MNKNSLIAIERIIACINELDILTKGRDAEYFYDSFDMNALCYLVDEIDDNLKNISVSLKEKYNDINWDIIANARKSDDPLGTDLKIGTTWELASHKLKDALLEKLIEILNQELPAYYTDLCNKMHEDFIENDK